MNRPHFSLVTSHFSRDFGGATLAGFLVVVFCGLLLCHDPLLFWNDDYELSILPVFADVARSWNGGHWPLLSPYSWVCNNLAGEYQYGTFSVVVNAAVVLIWKFPLTFPQQAAALSITHLCILAAGAFLLGRDRKLNVPLSIFVALIAALNGWIICWGATDWFGALAAFTWLPWCWWALEKSIRISANTQRSTPNAQSAEMQSFRAGGSAFGVQRSTFAALARSALWPAAFVYLLVTGGFPYTVLMLVVLIVWLAIKSIVQTKTLSSVLPMLAGAALGFGMSAPAWLALLDHVHGSARETQSLASHWQWIVPWRALPALILPCWSVNWTDFSNRFLPHAATELACGLVAPSAIIAGLIRRPVLVVRRLKWELVLLIVVLALSMFPTFGVFRWSFRWLPLFHLVLAVCAAEVIRLNRALPIASTSVLVLLAVTIAMSLFQTGGPYGASVTWIYFQIAVLWAVYELFLPRTRIDRWLPPLATFAIFLATYFCIPTNCGVPKYNLSQELTKPQPLDRNRLYLGVYSPAEYAYRREYRNGPVGQIARPGSTSLWAQLRFINGYSPILAAGVARELKFFIHGEIDADMGRYLVTNQAGHGGLLEELGVDGIVIAREIAVEPPADQWRLEFSNEEGRVFHRRGESFSPVRSIDWIDSLPEREFSAATISEIKDSRNQVSLDVNVPANGQSALLTFSRPYFNGYRAKVNHRQLRVGSYRGLFPIVEVPPGSQGRLTVSYRPTWLIWGGATAILSAIVFIAGCLFVAFGKLLKHSTRQPFNLAND